MLNDFNKRDYSLYSRGIEAKHKFILIRFKFAKGQERALDLFSQLLDNFSHKIEPGFSEIAITAIIMASIFTK